MNKEIREEIIIGRSAESATTQDISNNSNSSSKKNTIAMP